MIGNRYVAIMDILGFRTMVQERPLADMVQRIEYVFIQAATHQSAWAVHDPENGDVSGTLRFGRALFSDTLIIWSQPIDGLNRFHRSFEVAGFFHTISEVLFQGLLAEIPLRAGIAFGEAYIDESKGIFLGPAIVDAYLTEQAQEWVGGALHPSCPKTAYSLHYIQLVVNYPVPTKSDSKISLDRATNWPYAVHWRDLDPAIKKRSPTLIRDQVYGALQKQSEVALAERDKAKYLHAMEFAELQLRHLDQQIIEL